MPCQTDLVILPCDFIPPPDLSLSRLLDAYRMDTEEPILSALLYERGEVVKDGTSPSRFVFLDRLPELTSITLCSTGPSLFTVGLGEKNRTLLHTPTEEPGEDLQLRMSLMWK